MTRVDRQARLARRRLAALARPSEDFDARRYFRGVGDLGFYNVGSAVVRATARTIANDHRQEWTVEHACRFAAILISDRYLEVKSLGVEVLAQYRRSFTRSMLAVWKQWLAENHSANWATTDAICGLLIGPLLLAEPALIDGMLVWATDGNMWVRRASAVGLIPSVRRNIGLDTAYRVAARLHVDREDLIQKSVGWLLREAGKVDPSRLERYLRGNGPRIPRTTVRYAIERFDERKRRTLLLATLPPRAPHPPNATNKRKALSR